MSMPFSNGGAGDLDGNEAVQPYARKFSRRLSMSITSTASGLGNLVSSLARVRMYDGELKLLNLTKRVHDVMQVTKLDTVFDIMDDEAVALKSFRQSTGATG